MVHYQYHIYNFYILYGILFLIAKVLSLPTMAPYTREKGLQKKIEKTQKKRLKDAPKTPETCVAEEELDNKSFDSLKDSVSEGTLKSIKNMGYTVMTEIQRECIPRLLEFIDIRATARTGSGKTLTFLIPVIELIVKLKFKPRNGTGAIIISPTRELCMQTYGVLRELMKNNHFTFGLVMGGTNRKREAEKLSKGINILVATPGRLLDHLQNTAYFNIKSLFCLVIDEADRILEHGFGEDMKQIVKLIPEKRQTMLFSATKDQRTYELAKLFLQADPMEVSLSDKVQATPQGLEQAYLVAPPDKRFLLLYTFMRRYFKKKVMVFFSSCAAVQFYYDLLNYVGVPVMCIYGKQKQTRRVRTFYRFCNVDSGILLCTNVAARGWDIPAVDWIVQYDPPDDPKEYIHRVGRTARAGGKGNALLFLTDSELGFVRYLNLHKVTLRRNDIDWDKVAQVQGQFEQVVNPNYHLRAVGREAFVAYVRAYDSHSLKGIFDVSKLDLDKVATCFCLNKTPPVDIPSLSSSSTHFAAPQHKRRFNHFDQEESNEDFNRPKIVKFNDDE